MEKWEGETVDVNNSTLFNLINLNQSLIETTFGGAKIDVVQSELGIDVVN